MISRYLRALTSRRPQAQACIGMPGGRDPNLTARAKKSRGLPHRKPGTSKGGGHALGFN